MSNHSHLVLTPPDEKALARAIGRTHGRYTQYFNATYRRSGHLWQNRCYSCALDEEHLLRILRLTTHTGRPLGSPAFLAHNEALLGRRLQPGAPAHAAPDVTKNVEGRPGHGRDAPRPSVVG